MNALWKLAHALVCASALLMSQGCLTMFGRDAVDVSVTTTPPGMSVRTSEGVTKVTPCMFELNRARNHQLTLSDPKGNVLKSIEIKSEHSALRWLGSFGLNTVCHGWLTYGISSAIGMGFDAAQGATRTLDRDTIHEDFTDHERPADFTDREKPAGGPAKDRPVQATAEPPRRRVAGR